MSQLFYVTFSWIRFERVIGAIHMASRIYAIVLNADRIAYGDPISIDIYIYAVWSTRYEKHKAVAAWLRDGIVRIYLSFCK